MPVQPESLLKVYRGSHLLGDSYPVIVVTSDTRSANEYLGEFYIFHQYSDLPFLYQRTRTSTAANLSQTDLKQVSDRLSAAALLKDSLQRARQRLEFEIRKVDRASYQGLFQSAPSMEYQEINDDEIIEFRISRMFVEERETMFTFSCTHAMRELKLKLDRFPEIDFIFEPNV